MQIQFDKDPNILTAFTFDNSIENKENQEDFLEWLKVMNITYNTIKIKSGSDKTTCIVINKPNKLNEQKDIQNKNEIVKEIVKETVSKVNIKDNDDSDSESEENTESLNLKKTKKIIKKN